MFNYAFSENENEEDGDVIDVKLFDEYGEPVTTTYTVDKLTKQIDVTSVENGNYYFCFELSNGKKLLKSFYKN
ncbi:MAG: hypothetical protein H7331_04600 [Bacteroidia bacterium]|nr:hypothetical protein [Bacteroidia bacterium]